MKLIHENANLLNFKVMDQSKGMQKASYYLGTYTLQYI